MFPPTNIAFSIDEAALAQQLFLFFFIPARLYCYNIICVRDGDKVIVCLFIYLFFFIAPENRDWFLSKTFPTTFSGWPRSTIIFPVLRGVTSQTKLNKNYKFDYVRTQNEFM